MVSPRPSARSEPMPMADLMQGVLAFAGLGDAEVERVVACRASVMRAAARR
jgi:hypothetical protein